MVDRATAPATYELFDQASKILGPGGKDFHRGKLLNGEPAEQEAYAAKYGYQDAIGVIDAGMKANESQKGNDWYKSMEQLKADFLGRQGY